MRPFSCSCIRSAMTTSATTSPQCQVRRCARSCTTAACFFCGLPRPVHGAPVWLRDARERYMCNELSRFDLVSSKANSTTAACLHIAAGENPTGGPPSQFPLVCYARFAARERSTLACRPQTTQSRGLVLRVISYSGFRKCQFESWTNLK